MSFRTRFAPSPTGPLHLGHAYSALFAFDMAKRNGGRFLLRIEDIDRTRCRAEWEAQIFEDLEWLGIEWEETVLRQSDRSAAYRRTLKDLWKAGLVFACHCNRRDIREAASAPQEGHIPIGPDGVIYPGTCRENRVDPDHPEPPQDAALRLSISAARAALEGTAPLSFVEQGEGGTRRVSVTWDQLVSEVGDAVVSRKDMGTSYHLSVVLDDAAQGITDVVRGSDLFEATYIHVLLQRLLDLPTPTYHHHRLIRDDAGKRLAKRDDARAISKYRAEGYSPQDIRMLVGLEI